ncbi:MAG: ribonuclease III [Myxococcales bacterium]|nr:ribonuclease III [Myxococcales bacterium]
MPMNPKLYESGPFDVEDVESEIFESTLIDVSDAFSVTEDLVQKGVSGWENSAIRELIAPRTGTRPSLEVIQAQEALRRRLGHKFRRPELLELALSHPSWRNEHPSVPVDNQRMEFLGDLVVGLVMGEALLHLVPNGAEGDLSLLRQELVRERALAAVGEEIGIGAALRLGKGEEMRGGRHSASVLADAVEAVIGAVFLDGGYSAGAMVTMRMLGSRIDELVALYRTGNFESRADAYASTDNYKTALQVLLSRAQCGPATYTVVAQFGPSHAPLFRVQVSATVNGQSRSTQGEGSSKKTAEIEAARQLFQKLHGSGLITPR